MLADEPVASLDPATSHSVWSHWRIGCSVSARDRPT